MYFPNFSSNAKVWIYQSSSPLNAEIRLAMNKELKKFLGEWASHGTKLQADGEIIDEYRLVICTEGNIEASGCSIDASVRFIKDLGKKYTIDFFNRLQVLVDKNGQKELVHFSSLADDTNRFVFNNSPDNLGALRRNEKQSVSAYLAM